MSLLSPPRQDQSYRHEAFLWRESADFVAGLAPFIRDGLAEGEPVMVAVSLEHAAWLRDDLGTEADKVDFVDMYELGRNPARIIPAWQAFLDEHSGPGRPVRGVGEPIWPERNPDELAECQLHEALLNVAVDPELPFWLICPYDAARLPAAVVEEAHRSHPVIVEAGSYQGSPRYGGRAHVESLFAAPLPEPAERIGELPYDSGSLDRLFSFVAFEAYALGLPVDQATDLATAVQQIARTSLERGARPGHVRVWDQAHAVVCEVADEVEVDDVLLGRRPLPTAQHDGLWLANQLCDLVQLRSGPGGTTVRAQTWKRLPGRWYSSGHEGLS